MARRSCETAGFWSEGERRGRTAASSTCAWRSHTARPPSSHPNVLALWPSCPKAEPRATRRQRLNISTNATPSSLGAITVRVAMRCRRRAAALRTAEGRRRRAAFAATTKFRGRPAAREAAVAVIAALGARPRAALSAAAGIVRRRSTTRRVAITVVATLCCRRRAAFTPATKVGRRPAAGEVAKAVVTALGVRIATRGAAAFGVWPATIGAATQVSRGRATIGVAQIVRATEGGRIAAAFVAGAAVGRRLARRAAAVRHGRGADLVEAVGRTAIAVLGAGGPVFLTARFVDADLVDALMRTAVVRLLARLAFGFAVAALLLALFVLLDAFAVTALLSGRTSGRLGGFGQPGERPAKNHSQRPTARSSARQRYNETIESLRIHSEPPDYYSQPTSAIRYPRRGRRSPIG
jgi:hypothetical protein